MVSDVKMQKFHHSGWCSRIKTCNSQVYTTSELTENLEIKLKVYHSYTELWVMFITKWTFNHQHWSQNGPLITNIEMEISTLHSHSLCAILRLPSTGGVRIITGINPLMIIWTMHQDIMLWASLELHIIFSKNFCNP